MKKISRNSPFANTWYICYVAAMTFIYVLTLFI